MSKKNLSGTDFAQLPTFSGFQLGYLIIPQVVQNANATFALADRGKHWIKTNTTAYTWTIPLDSAVAFENGTAIAVAGFVIADAAVIAGLAAFAARRQPNFIG